MNWNCILYMTIAILFYNLHSGFFVNESGFIAWLRARDSFFLKNAIHDRSRTYWSFQGTNLNVCHSIQSAGVFTPSFHPLSISHKMKNHFNIISSVCNFEKPMLKHVFQIPPTLSFLISLHNVVEYSLEP